MHEIFIVMKNKNKKDAIEDYYVLMHSERANFKNKEWMNEWSIEWMNEWKNENESFMKKETSLFDVCLHCK